MSKREYFVLVQCNRTGRDSHKNLFRKESSRGQEDLNISSYQESKRFSLADDFEGTVAPL